MNISTDTLFIMPLAISAVSLNMIVGFPLNCCVIWLILTKRTLDSDIFSLNLALAEIFYSFSSMFFFFNMFTGCGMCRPVYIFSAGFVFTARPLFQCCICMESYVGVVHPVFFLKCKPLRHRVVFSCIVWLIVLTSCTYSLFNFTKLTYHYGYFVQNLLFMFVMLFCCFSVLKALKHPGPGEKDTGKKTSNRAKRKAFKIISIITMYMTINFFLYVFVIPLQNCLTRMIYLSAMTLCVSLAVVTGFIQPLLYLHRSGKLKFYESLLNRMLPCLNE